MNFDKIKAPTVRESFVRELENKILSGELRPGDRLPAERDMAAQLGVSRSSLHHAVLQLETQGFLEIEPRRGTVVADYRKHPTPSSLSALVGYGSLEIDEPLFHDFMDARIWLETGSARRACRSIYESTFDEMSSIASRIAPGAEDLPGMIYRYHYLLTQASGNSLFSMMFRAFEPVLTTLITAYYTRPDADIAAEAAELDCSFLSTAKSRASAPAGLSKIKRRILTVARTVPGGFPWSRPELSCPEPWMGL